MHLKNLAQFLMSRKLLQGAHLMPSFTVISISAEEDPRLLFFNMYVFCIINSDHLFILKVIC